MFSINVSSVSSSIDGYPCSDVRCRVRATTSDVQRITLRPAHETPGLFVADDLAFAVVPLELAAEQEREVAQHGEDGHVDGGFDVHDRLLAGLDAFEPILLVAGAAVDVHRARAGLPLAGLPLGPGAAVAAPVGERALVAVIHGAVAGAGNAAARLVAGALLRRRRFARLVPGEHPIGILERVLHVDLHGRIPQAAARCFARGFDLDRPGAVGVHPPHGAAHHVGAAIADLSAARFHQPAERAVAVAAVVRPPAERAEPEVPVQFGAADRCRAQTRRWGWDSGSSRPA